MQKRVALAYDFLAHRIRPNFNPILGRAVAFSHKAV